MSSPPSPVRVKALFCPNCGGSVQLRGFANTLTVVCQHCTAVLDATTPLLRVLQEAQSREARATPLIPLGSRGKIYGASYEVIGFQRREASGEGWSDAWCEYVLFNPYRGFLYLTEYKGHWNVVRPVHAIPVQRTVRRRAGVELDGRAYAHFQKAQARTAFVLGEFPWRLQVGETVTADDYISPPYMLSAERTYGEVTWSLGEYTPGAALWKAFQLKGSPPRAAGIFSNQPNPNRDRPRQAWRLCGVFQLLLLAMVVLFAASAQQRAVLNERHHFYPGQRGEASFVTPIFELTGHDSNVEVRTVTDLDNNWVYINYALINADNGRAWDFGREVSYYHGRDSGGDWTEGSRNDSAVIPAVPAGRYYLRVEPESDPGNKPVEYDIVVRRDVPSYLFFAIAALLLCLPPAVMAWRSYEFDYMRWQESDYAK
jgi:hypothetical protein